MPGLTTPMNYPYPLYTEAANGAPQIQALAEAVDDSLVAVQATIALITDRKLCKAEDFGVQAIPNNTSTVLTFGTESADTDNMLNLGVNNTIATVNTAGHYMVNGDVEFDSNATGDRRLLLVWSGGGTASNLRVRAAQSGSTTRLEMCQVFNATVGQTFRVEVLQTSGGALNVTTRRFSCVRVSG